jgi:hypothetical protein
MTTDTNGVTIPEDATSAPFNPNTPTPAPTQSPTKAPTAAPTPCTSLDCFAEIAEILLNNTATDAEALQDDSSPQFQAMRWLANYDPAVLDLDSTPAVVLVQRYVLAVFYFATGSEGRLSNELNFLSASSVCDWNNGDGDGVVCNGGLVTALNLGT